jgi:hypothetical protein
MVRTSDNSEITLGRKLLSDFGASILVVGCYELKVFGGSLNYGFQVLRTTEFGSVFGVAGLEKFDVGVIRIVGLRVLQFSTRQSTNLY